MKRLSSLLLLALTAAAGIGSGVYHPFGALNASAVIDDDRQRNTAMSIYVTGGTLGVALGPLLGAWLFTEFGTHGTAVMLLPGVLIAVWLLLEIRPFASRPRTAKGGQGPAARVPLVPLLAVIGVMMSRVWTVHSLEAFVPTWYASLGGSEIWPIRNLRLGASTSWPVTWL